MSNAERWRHHKQLPGDIEERLETLPSLLAARGVKLAYLFGSLSQGRSGHDVDLALMSDREPAYKLRDAIVEWLGTERVDIVDLRRSSPVLQMEIVETGQVLYAVDDTVQLDFEMATLRDYRDTAYLRARQERRLRERLAP